MRMPCVYTTARTIDAERIDITVNSIKRYYGNATRASERASRSTRRALRESVYAGASRLVRRLALLPCPSLLSRAIRASRPRVCGLFREITEKPRARAGKCAGNGHEAIPPLPRGRISFWETTSTVRLDCAFRVRSSASARLSLSLVQIDTRDANDGANETRRSILRVTIITNIAERSLSLPPLRLNQCFPFKCFTFTERRRSSFKKSTI